jgi:uncharacterized protein YdaU (DUF1376 family)
MRKNIGDLMPSERERRELEAMIDVLDFDDLISSTRHLTMLESSGYLMLLVRYYHDRGLPNDDHDIARLLNASYEKWMLVRPALVGLFEQPGWRHEYLDLRLQEDRKLDH